MKVIFEKTQKKTIPQTECQNGNGFLRISIIYVQLLISSSYDFLGFRLLVVYDVDAFGTQG